MAWIRLVASSIISVAAGERVASVRWTTANVSYVRGRSDTQPAFGASRGSSCSAAPLAMTLSAYHPHQLDGRLDVLDLDPAGWVAAGLVKQVADGDPGGVLGAPARVGHDQRGQREPVRGDRRGQMSGVGRDVDELVACHRRDLQAGTGDAADEQHCRFEPSASQVLLDLG